MRAITWMEDHMDDLGTQHIEITPGVTSDKPWITEHRITEFF